MNDVDVLLDRYARAVENMTEIDGREPSVWHLPDVIEFEGLRAQMEPYAEDGNPYCQYALASIEWLGWCCQSEEQYYEQYPRSILKATQWWIAAAKQGHWGALDNLITCGVGDEADRVREAFREFEAQRPELIGTYDEGPLPMPIYGPGFMQQLCLSIYGCVISEED